MHNGSPTIGAHLLLWVFPLCLTLVVVVLHLATARRRSGNGGQA